MSTSGALKYLKSILITLALAVPSGAPAQSLLKGDLLSLRGTSIPVTCQPGQVRKSSSDNTLQACTPSGVFDKFALLDATQTLINKTIDLSNFIGGRISFGEITNTNNFALPNGSTSDILAVTPGEGMLAYDGTLQKPVYYNGTSWTAVGSGSGSGETNYIENYGFNEGITGVTTYDDGASYADGTGGSPTAIAVTQNVVTPLEGLGSLVIAKGSSSCVGEGASIASLTVDAYAAERGYLNWRTQVDFTSTNYVAGDVQLKAYDVTNSAALTITPIGGLDTSGGVYKAAGMLAARVNVLSTTRQVRLSFHCQTDNASASTWTAKVDFVRLGPDNLTSGAFITQPVAYTPTFTGFGTVSNVNFTSWREGAFLLVSGKFTSGTSTSTEARVTLGYNGVNGGVTAASTVGSPQLVGYPTRSATAAVTFTVLAEPSVGYVTFGIQDGTRAGLTKQNGDQIVGNGVAFSFFAKVQIEGWAASNYLSTTEVNLQNPANAPTTATSSVKTPGATANYHALSGNSLTITRGTWNLTGGCMFANGGVSPAYTAIGCGFYSANGADSASAPAALSSGSGITVVSVGTSLSSLQEGLSSATNMHTSPAPTKIKCSSATCTVYLVSYAAMTTAANARVTVYANAEQQSDFSVFGSYLPFEVLATTSSQKTPGATNNFHALSGNSITLTAGAWRLFGSCLFGNNGSGPGYTGHQCSWYGANGADSASVPTALSAVSGLTVLSADQSPTLYRGAHSADNNLKAAAPDVIVRCASSCTVYLDTYALLSTAANARITVYANAQRLQ